MLVGEPEKCPSCGAPTRFAKRRGGKGRLKIASFVFIGLFLLMAFQGAFILWDAEGPLQDGATFSGQNFDLRGRVTDADGTPIEGARVALTDDATVNATTTADGEYALRDVSSGYHLVNYSAPNRTTVQLRTFLFMDGVDANVELPPGNATEQRTHSSYSQMVGVINFCGGFLIVLGLLLLAGAIATYRRRFWGLALTAALFSLVGVIFYWPTLILSLTAIILVARSRKEFR